MWWSRAILGLMVLAAGPVGCGFQPIYGRDRAQASSPMAEQLASVRVGAIDDRIGQQLRNALVQSLTPRGEPATPRYLLDVKLSSTLVGMANSKDGKTRIGRVDLSAPYILLDSSTGTVLYNGTATAFSGYREMGPRYATTASEREAENIALTEIAASIRTALAAYFVSPQALREKQPQLLLEQHRRPTGTGMDMGMGTDSDTDLP